MRHLFVLAILVVAAFAVPVLTAQAPRPAGAAVGGVSGFRVADVSFALDDARPDRVHRISFTLAPPTASTVRVEVGGSRTSCTVDGGRAVCTFSASAPPLRRLSSLTVLAAS